MDELAAEDEPHVKPTLVDITFLAPKVKSCQYHFRKQIRAVESLAESLHILCEDNVIITF
jgi:hypothetical protein